MAKKDKNFEMNNPAEVFNSAESPPTPQQLTEKYRQQGDPPATPPSPQQILLMAIEAHFNAQRSRAVANLNTYMNSAVGVGEHPDVVGECIKLIEDVDHAESAIQTLGRIIQ
jgi:hypothetical protein